MRKTVIEIEHIQSGQPRAYADSFYEAIITSSSNALTDGAWFYHRLNEERAKEIFRLFVRSWADKPAWHEARLEKCEPIGPTPEMTAKAHPKWKPQQDTRWRVLVREPYLD